MSIDKLKLINTWCMFSEISYSFRNQNAPSLSGKDNKQEKITTGNELSNFRKSQSSV